MAGSAQARRKAGRTLLDGVHLCESYLQHGGVPALVRNRRGAPCDIALTQAEAAAPDPQVPGRWRRTPAWCCRMACIHALIQVENGVAIAPW